MGSIDKRDNTPQLLNRLRMRQVALILAIDERQTLRAAAAELGLTQPAATKMLQELEDALGQPLFERVGRRLQRNAAGERVLEYFRSLRGNIEALNRELGELRQGSSGRLAVGSIMAASPGRLTQALLELKKQLPLLELEVAVDTSDRLLAQLREGVLEVVVGRMTNEAGSDCRFCPIDDEQLAFIVRRSILCCRCSGPPCRLCRAWLGDAAAWQPHAQLDRAGVPRAQSAAAARPDRNRLHTHHHQSGAKLEHGGRDSAHGGGPSCRPRHAAYPAVSDKRSLEAYGSLVRKDRPISRSAQMFLDLLHRHDAAA
jgi:DNA-binding transcriptional LysR family regulator